MNKEEVKEKFDAWFDTIRTESRGFHSEFHCGANMGYQQAVKDMNDNQHRGLPADIDLLIQAANAVVRQVDDRRVLHLKSVVEEVKLQYDALFKDGDHE
jgi:hypothetical protein